MPLEKDIIDIPLGVGLQSTISSDLVQPGQGMLTMANVDFRETGAINRRNGFASAGTLPATVSSNVCGQMMRAGNYLLAASQPNADATDASLCFRNLSTASDWQKAGITDVAAGATTPATHLPFTSTYLPVQLTKQAIRGAASDYNCTIEAQASAVVGDVMYVATLKNGLAAGPSSRGVCVMAYDVNTGAVLLPETIIDYAADARFAGTLSNKVVHVVNLEDYGYVYVVYPTSANTVKATAVTIAGVGSTVTLATDVAGSGKAFDLDVFRGTVSRVGAMVLGYWQTATNDLAVSSWGVSAGTLTQLGTTTFNVAQNPTADPVAVAKWSADETAGSRGVAVCWVSAGGVKVKNFTVNDAATVITATGAELAVKATGFDVTACEADKSASTPAVQIFYRFTSTTSPEVGVVRVTNAGVVTGYERTFAALSFASKPVFVDRIGYRGVYMLVRTQRDVNTALVRIAGEGITSAAAPRLGAIVPVARTWDGFSITYTGAYGASSCATFADDSLWVTQLILDSSALGGTYIMAVGVTRVELTPSRANPAAELGGLALLAGGETAVFDGLSVSEAGFSEQPVVTAGSTVSGGGALQDGTYSVVAIYSWVDNAGNIFYSPVSDPLTVTLSGGANWVAEVAVTNYRLSRRGVPLLLRSAEPINCKVEIYRTVASGSLYYLCAETTGAALTSQNITAVPISAYTDAQLISKKALYTTGGVLEDVAPPHSTSACSTGVRAFLYCDGEIWFSKYYTAGAGLNWCAEFVKPLIPDGSSKCTLVAMDGRVIALRENSIQWFDGDGPSNTGFNGAFSEVRIIPTDDGGAKANTPAVVTAKGCFFLGRSGRFRLLTRSLEVVDIGLPTDALGAWSYGDVRPLVAAVNAPEEQKVYFVVGTHMENLGASQTASIFVYDYDVGQWLTAYSGSSAGDILTGAAHYQGKLAVVNGGSRIVYESDGLGSTYDDAGTAITSTFRTPWIRVGNLQGFQRLWHVNVFGKLYSTHQQRLTIYYDYGASVVGGIASETVVIPVTTAVHTLGRFQYRHNIGRKCEAVSFEITVQADDAPYDVPGRACSWSGITLEIGRKRGSYKIPASVTV